jgi:hypothetical protein
MSRAEERRRDWIAAQREKINSNGYRHETTVSVRTTVEAQELMAAPDPQPAPLDHAPSGSVGVIQYVGSVRERLEREAARKREEKTAATTPSAGANNWLAYNERYRAEHSEYPRN